MANQGQIGIRVIPNSQDFRRDLKKMLERAEKTMRMSLTVDTTKARAALKKAQAEMRDTEIEVAIKPVLARQWMDGLQKVREEVEDLEPAVNADADTAAAQASLATLTRPRTVSITASLSQSSIAAVGSQLAALSGARVGADAIRGLGSALSNLDRSLPSLSAVSLAITNVGSAALSSAAGLLTLGADLSSVAGAGLALPGILGGIAAGGTTLALALADTKEQLGGLAPLFSDLQNSVSSAVWSEMRAPIIDMVQNVLPGFQEQMTATGAAVGSFGAEAASVLQGSLTSANIAPMFDNLNESIRIAQGAIQPLVDAFMTLGEVGSGYLPRMAQWITDISARFNEWVQSASEAGQITAWIDGGISALQDLGSIVGSVASTFGGLASAAEAAGGGGLAGLADVMARIAETVNSPAFQTGLIKIFAGAGQAMSSLGQAIGPVGSAIGSLASTISGVLVIAGQTLSTVLQGVAEAISRPAFQTGLTAFFQGIQQGVNALIPALGPLADLFGQVGQFAGQLAATLGPVLGAAISTLAPVVSSLLTAIQPLIPVLGDALMQVIQALAPILQQIPPIISLLVQAISPLIGIVAQLVTSLLPVLTPILQVISQVIQTLMPVVQLLAGAFSQVIAAIAPLIVQLVSQLAPIFTQLVQAILPPVMQIVQAIVAVLPQLVSLFTMVATTVLGLVQAFAPLVVQLVSSLAPIIADLVATLLPQVVSALQMVVPPIMDLVTSVASILIPVIQRLMPIVQTVFQTISSVIQSAMTIIQGIIQVVTGIISGDWSRVWTGIQNIASGVWNAITAVIEGAINIVMSVISSVLSGISALWSSIWSSISSVASSIWSAIKAVIGSAINGVMSIISSVLSGIASLWSSIWSTISSVASSIWAGIRSVISSAISGVLAILTSILSSISSFWNSTWSAIQSYLANAWSSIVSAVSSGISEVLSFFSSLPGEIGSFLSGLPGQLLSIGKDMVQGLIDGIGNMASAVTDAITGVVDGALGAAKDFLGISSPSKVFRGIGEWTGEGFAIGINRTGEQVRKAADGMVKQTTDAFAERNRIVDSSNRELERMTPKLASEGTSLSRSLNVSASRAGQAEQSAGVGGREVVQINIDARGARIDSDKRVKQLSQDLASRISEQDRARGHVNLEGATR